MNLWIYGYVRLDVVSCTPRTPIRLRSLHALFWRGWNAPTLILRAVIGRPHEISPAGFQDGPEPPCNNPGTTAPPPRIPEQRKPASYHIQPGGPAGWLEGECLTVTTPAACMRRPHQPRLKSGVSTNPDRRWGAGTATSYQHSFAPVRRVAWHVSKPIGCIPRLELWRTRQASNLNNGHV